MILLQTNNGDEIIENDHSRRTNKKTIKYNPMMIKSVHTDSSIKGNINN